MKVLSGNETPEQLMMYLKNFEDKIYKNAVLTAQEKFAILKRIVDKEAQTIVSEVENDYEGYLDPEDVDEIKDYKIQVNIRSTYTTDNQIRVYFGASGTAAAKKERIEHIIQESIYHHKVKIFGNERLGLSSFIQLKRTATQLKVSSNCRIKVWIQLFNTFQEYLSRTLWIAGARRSEWPTAFDEERKREILEFVLPHTYLKALSSESWCLSKNTFEESIGKITEIEPMILTQEKDKKLTAANATAIKELQDSIANKRKGKHNGGGGGRSNSANKDKDKGNGLVNKEGHYLCGTCNKRHNGTCRLFSNESNPCNTPTKK